MATSFDGPREFNVSRVLSRGFDAMTANLIAFFVIALIFAGPPAFLLEWWQQARAQTVTDPSQVFTWTFWSPTLIAMLISMVAGAIVQAALTRATVVHLSGGKPDLGACLGTGIAMIVPLVVIGFLQGLGLIIGFILLFVPGLILMVMWAVVVPAYVQERPGIIESFSRSAELTKGARWSIFGVFILIGIAVWLVQLVGGYLATAVASSQPMVSAFMQAVISAVSSMISLTIAATIYVELRDVKDGVGPSELEEIFA